MFFILLIVEWSQNDPKMDPKWSHNDLKNGSSPPPHPRLGKTKLPRGIINENKHFGGGFHVY